MKDGRGYSAGYPPPKDSLGHCQLHPACEEPVLHFMLHCLTVESRVWTLR